MTETPVPVAVIGVGNMGANHARVYDELPESELVEFVEPNATRARELEAEYGISVHETVDDISRATAATVAVPNNHHREIAERCLTAGLDILVEKPLATTIADAESIVETAEANDAILQVGHIERFNPVVQSLKEILEDEEVIALEAHRLGPFNQHLSEMSVVFDLMIHDIDIIDWLVDGDIEHLNALGTTPRSEQVDHAVLQLKYGNDVLGIITASHVTHGKIRTLQVTTRDAYIEVDYQDQSIVLQRRGIEETTTLLNQSGYRTETATESPYIQTREPLKNELEHFLECVSTHETPRVSGADGVRAVALTNDVADRILSTESSEMCQTTGDKTHETS